MSMRTAACGRLNAPRLARLVPCEFLLAGLLAGTVCAAELPFDLSYPSAATPGETVRMRLTGGDGSTAKAVTLGRQEEDVTNGEAVLHVPEQAVPGTSLPVTVITHDSERHPLPAVAIVPESSRFGRAPLITGLPPLPAPASRRVALPARVPNPHRVNGWEPVTASAFLDGPWPAEGVFFVRAVQADGRAAYSDPIWLAPLIGREETYVDYQVDVAGRQLADRWERRPSRAAGEAVVRREDGLAVLRFPARQPVAMDIDDMPSGPLTLSIWLRPLDAGKEQIVRASPMMTLGIDRAGRFYARRLDEMRNECRATSGSPLQPGAWQHVAAVFDGAAVRLYLDGRETASAPCSGRKSVPRRSYETLGALNEGRQPFIGEVAACAVYNRALPAATLHELAASFHDSFPAPTTSPSPD